MSPTPPEIRQKILDTKDGITLDLRSNSNDSLLSDDTREIIINCDTPRASYESRLKQLKAVTLEVVQFSDGRIFSTVRWLKSHPEFKGQLYAFGQFIPDQAQYLFRCGVDFIELDEQWLDRRDQLEGVVYPSLAYQSALPSTDPIDQRNIRFLPVA